MGEDKMKIGSIVIHCYEFDRMLAFWRDALAYRLREPVLRCSKKLRKAHEN